jgi:hypothetical protein
MSNLILSMGSFGVLFAFFLLILWTLLPFAVFGLKARLDAQTNVLRDIRTELRNNSNKSATDTREK